MTLDPISQRRFRVALSFSGDRRDFVRQVAAELVKALGRKLVFFDEYCEPELARPDLDLYLGAIYREDSDLIVPFYSTEYSTRKWCRLEWRQMRDILLNIEGDRIMPFRFDSTPIAGVLSLDGYSMIGARTASQVATMILERLGGSQVKPRSGSGETAPVEPAASTAPASTPSAVFHLEKQKVGSQVIVGRDATFHGMPQAPQQSSPSAAAARPRQRSKKRSNGEKVAKGSKPSTSVTTQPIGRPRGKALSASSGAQRMYVVFCKIVGLGDLKADEIAGCQQALIDLAAEWGRGHPSDFGGHQPSVYGRILFVCEALPAIEASIAMLQGAAKRGVGLDIGVAVGNVEPSDDLGWVGFAGPAISTAARLANLKDADQGVAVDARVYEDAQGHSASRRYTFGEEKQGKVKRTELIYRKLPVDLGSKRSEPPKVTYDGPKSAHVVVFDLAQFSEQDADGQWEVVKKLMRRVNEVAQALSLSGLIERGRLWSAPAGDGGALVFSTEDTGASKAFLAAERLATLCSDYVNLRVAVNTGLVVVIEGGLPVGTGLLRADVLCGYPKAGQICVSKRFWGDELPAKERTGWKIIPVASDAQALVVVRRNLGDSEDSGSGGGGSGGSGGGAGEAVLRRAIDQVRLALDQLPRLRALLEEAFRSKDREAVREASDLIKLMLGEQVVVALKIVHQWIKKHPSDRTMQGMQPLLESLPLLGLSPAWGRGGQKAIG
jgi:rhodanese-related sulfurtransferase